MITVGKNEMEKVTALQNQLRREAELAAQLGDRRTAAKLMAIRRFLSLASSGHTVGLAKQPA